jgi:hypothetical protein
MVTMKAIRVVAQRRMIDTDLLTTRITTRQLLVIVKLLTGQVAVHGLLAVIKVLSNLRHWAILLSLVGSVEGERRRARGMGLMLKLPFIVKERAGTRD